MKTSFKAECFREQRLGTVLNPRKGGNPYYVKTLFGVVIENQE